MTLADRISVMYITLMSVIMAGVLNMVFIKTPFFKRSPPPIDGGRTLRDGKRLFGDNKTRKGFCGMVVCGGVSQAERIDGTLRLMTDSVNGRVYYRISSWYDVILLLPFSKRIIPVWQEMLGSDPRERYVHVHIHGAAQKQPCPPSRRGGGGQARQRVHLGQQGYREHEAPAAALADKAEPRSGGRRGAAESRLHPRGIWRRS